MRRSVFLLTLLAAGSVAAGCASSASVAWTYAPASASAAPSGSGAAASPGASAAGPSESAAGSLAPSGSVSASGAPSAAATTGTTGTPVALTAQNIAFQETTLQAPADNGFVIHFDNKDNGVPHNVEIVNSAGQSLFKGEIFNGPGTRDYQVNPLPAGSYQFHCSVHTNMTGTLTVGG